MATLHVSYPIRTLLLHCVLIQGLEMGYPSDPDPLMYYPVKPPTTEHDDHKIIPSLIAPRAETI